MKTNNDVKKDAANKAYYKYFEALRIISTYLLIGDAFLLLLGFASHTLFLAFIVLAAINIATSVLMLWFSIYGIKKLGGDKNANRKRN